MADEEVSEGEAAEDKKSSGGIVKMAILGVVLVVVIVVSNIGTLIMAKSMMPDLIYPEWMMALQPEPVVEEEEVIEEVMPPVYTRMNPQIIVSYQDGSSVRFLQITLEAMARDEESIMAFELNIPRIRNDLLILFASESLEYLSTIEGKENVRAKALAKVQEILTEENKNAKIEDIYFTSFVVQ